MNNGLMGLMSPKTIWKEVVKKGANNKYLSFAPLVCCRDLLLRQLQSICDVLAYLPLLELLVEPLLLLDLEEDDLVELLLLEDLDGL